MMEHWVCVNPTLCPVVIALPAEIENSLKYTLAKSVLHLNNGNCACPDAPHGSILQSEDVGLRAKEVQLAHRADVNYRIIDPNLH